MQREKRVLAFDFGASSGRAIIGHFDGENIRLEEIHRFSNDPVQVGGTLYWDVLRLFYEIKQGIVKAKLAAGELETEDDIRNAIKEGEQKFDVSLDESEEQQIVDFMLKIKKLGLDPNVLLDQAADLYSKFGDELLNKATDDGFFSGLGNIVNSIADFFKGLFKK